jgi:hypothetical protein
MTHVQIAKMEPGSPRWDWVAHGAAWPKGEAQQMAERLKARGAKVRLLPVER